VQSNDFTVFSAQLFGGDGQSELLFVQATSSLQASANQPSHPPFHSRAPSTPFVETLRILILLRYVLDTKTPELHSWFVGCSSPTCLSVPAEVAIGSRDLPAPKRTGDSTTLHACACPGLSKSAGYRFSSLLSPTSATQPFALPLLPLSTAPKLVMTMRRWASKARLDTSTSWFPLLGPALRTQPALPMSDFGAHFALLTP
jgi:hypothetical protein